MLDHEDEYLTLSPTEVEEMEAAMAGVPVVNEALAQEARDWAWYLEQNHTDPVERTL